MWVRHKNSGFTIVELLIVIVIIGILAAIVVVAYTGITNSAKESAIKSDLVNVKKKMLVYKVTNGTYPTSTIQLSAADIKASKTIYDTTANNFYYCYNRATDEFAIGARTVSNSVAYINSSSGDLQKVAGVGADNACQAIGLSGWADSDAFNSSGHASGSGWQSWVK